MSDQDFPVTDPFAAEEAADAVDAAEEIVAAQDLVEAEEVAEAIVEAETAEEIAELEVLQEAETLVDDAADAADDGGEDGTDEDGERPANRRRRRGRRGRGRGRGEQSSDDAADGDAEGETQDAAAEGDEDADGEGQHASLCLVARGRPRAAAVQSSDASGQITVIVRWSATDRDRHGHYLPTRRCRETHSYPERCRRTAPDSRWSYFLLVFFGPVFRGPEFAGAGACHFPADRDAGYFEQLTAEVKRTKFIRGFPVPFFWKPDHARNEALDCRVYAYAALHGLFALGFKLNANAEQITAAVEAAKAAGQSRPAQAERALVASPVRPDLPQAARNPNAPKPVRPDGWIRPGRARSGGWLSR